MPSHPLLMDEWPMYFSPSAATRMGLEKAVLFQGLVNVYEQVIRDNGWTMADLASIQPWLKPARFRKLFKELVEEGKIEVVYSVKRRIAYLPDVS